MQNDPVVTLDLSTLTLGEMAAAEEASGRDFGKMLAGGRSTRLLLALWVHEQRTSAQPRNWQELSALNLTEVSSSISPSSPDGAPVKSSD